MRQFLRFLCLCLVLPFTGKATHIVGGEFQLTHQSGFTYEINLTLYFDDINGSPQALDAEVNLHFFRKFDNAFINTVVVNLDNSQGTFVNYTNPRCTTGTAVVLSTKIFTYTRLIELTPNLFSHPAGYYVVWDRCCRNNNINNIDDPGGTGQMFYMEFPPVVSNGQPFVNSSPTLFKPLNDYACLGRLFQFDFGGADGEGDSLVYSLTNPLRGLGTRDNPRPLDPPFTASTTVTWMPGFDENRQVRGSLPLSIDPRTGRLSLIPGELGLHVFAIKVDEYRNGVKIGQVNREFQLLVRDCPFNAPPRVQIENPAMEGGFLGDNDTMRIDGRCFTLRLSDSISNAPSDSLYLTIKSTLPGSTFERYRRGFRVRSATDTAIVQYCLPGCDSSLINRFYPINISVRDDGCAVPLRDSVTIQVYFEIENPRPPALTLLSGISDGDTISIRLGQSYSFQITASDSGEVLTFSTIHPGGAPVVSHGYLLEAGANSRADSLGYTVIFNPCNAQPGIYPYTWVVKDDACPTGSDSTTIYLKINSEGISPQASLPNPPGLKDGVPAYTVVAGQQLTIPVAGRDTTDRVYLSAFSPDLNVNLPAFSFSADPNGNRQFISGNFNWNTTCKDTSSKPYRIYFLAEDSAFCLLPSRDTVLALVFVVPDLPTQNYYLLFNGDTLRQLSAGLIHKDVIEFELIGEADKPIPMELSYRASPGSRNETFAITQESQRIKGVFRYTAKCEDVSSDSIIYAFQFRSVFCETPTIETIRVAIAAKDTLPSEFIPPNVVTLNGDGKNDSWYIYNRIPEQTCNYVMEQCTIYNRWGKPIFETTDPRFEWKPVIEDTGMFFYYIRFKDKAYRGWIQVLTGTE